MVLLQSSQDRASSKIILPLIGKTEFNSQSIITVEDHETANELIKMVPFLGLKIVGGQDAGVDKNDGEKIQKKSEEDELNPGEGKDKIEGESEEDFEKIGQGPVKSVEDQLKNSSLAQLKEFAEILTQEDPSVKKIDWSKKNKADLLEFLLDKIE